MAAGISPFCASCCLSKKTVYIINITFPRLIFAYNGRGQFLMNPALFAHRGVAAFNYERETYIINKTFPG
jgi:hypothetical protein